MGTNVLIIEARFYDDIADELTKGAQAVLDSAGCKYTRVAVPGVFEVPATLGYAIHSMETGTAELHYAGFIALGAIIRGETDHYDHICRESCRALMELAVSHQLAFGFGILTCETHDQAWARAAVDQKNKGADAARACLRMIEVKDSFQRVPK